MEIDDLLDIPSPAPKGGGGKFKPRPKTEPNVMPYLSVELVKIEEGIGLATDLEFGCNGENMDVDVIVKPGVQESDLMDMETEDEVVREIDVYFAPSFDPGTQIYLFQFPLREKWRPYELDDKCQGVRVNPGSREVEVDLRIDVDSRNYDYDADPRVRMEKQTLTTIWQQPAPPCCYSVGVLNENKLHLHPIHAVVQLRPSMRHLDSKDSGKKTVAKNVGDTAKAEASNDAEKLTWLPLKYHPGRSDLARKYMHLMITRGGPPINFSMNLSDYMTSLCGTCSNSSSADKILPRRSLLHLPLKDRFETYFREGPPVHRFDTLKYLAPDESVEEIFEIVQQLAVLVQGLWVPKSTLICEKHEGNEVLARDYVLLSFSQKIYVEDSEFRNRGEKLYREMKKFLNIFAVERKVLSDWKLRELPDMGFTKRYPSVVKEQQDKWEILNTKIANYFDGIRNARLKTISKSNASSDQAKPKVTPKLAPKTLAEGARGNLSEGSKAAIAKALQKLFKRDKVCSFTQIGELLKGIVMSECQKESKMGGAMAIAKSIDAFPQEIQIIINQLVADIHGIGVLKSSPDHPEYDDFRKFVINYFTGEGSNAKLRRGPLLEAAKEALRREISKIECDKVLHELCTSQGSAWMLRSAEGNPKQ